ncbi:MAG: dynamin family protein [Wolinella sp.]
MTKVYLEHNPFSEVTKCEIDGKDVAKNEGFSKCWGDPKKSFFQDWVGDFFQQLHDVENREEYEVEFFGLPSDYKDLENAKNEFREKNSGISIELIQKDVHVKSAQERIEQLKGLFSEMQADSPYDELKAEDIKRSFDGALGKDEEIGIVATMSSGKSTLLNAILHQDLLPARNEATTAIVAKIYNDNSKKEFRVSASDRDGNAIYDDIVATPEILEKLNGNKDVANLRLFGNIPNIKGYGLRVVLSDTPGPNNSVDESHKIHTYNLIGEAYKPMILYIFNATQLEVNDDKALLEDIAKEIKSSGIQSKDRFIFVVNKIDGLDPKKEESAKKAIEKLEEYLKGFNIHEPRIFPTSAQLSRVIRLEKSGENKLTEDDEDFLKIKVRRFVENKERHLHELAPLSKEGKGKLDELIKKAEKAKEDGDDLPFADICSGVPALEIAINEYVEKYAIRQKIKLSVQSFKGFIEKQKIKAQSQESIANSEESKKEVLTSLESIRKDMENNTKAQAMRERVSSFDSVERIKKYLDKKRGELSKITGDLSSSDSKMDRFEAKRYMEKVKKAINDFRIQFLGHMENEINKGFFESVTKMFEEYRSYVASLLSDNSSLSNIAGEKISIDSILDVDLDEGRLLYEFRETITTQERHTRGNIDKAWYKFWTWFDDPFEVYYTTNQEEVFDAEKFSEEFFSSLYRGFNKETDRIEKEVAVRVDRFKEFFNKKTKELEKKMMEQINEQEKLYRDQAELERVIEHEHERVKWLERFSKKLENILEIQGA